MNGSNKSSKAALRFILLIGVVSFFADFTYEGSRSITGPLLAVLGASATAVGIIAGLRELLGYGLRLVSGPLSERTGEFWPITLVGYVIQVLAVPAADILRYPGVMATATPWRGLTGPEEAIGVDGPDDRDDAVGVMGEGGVPDWTATPGPI